MPLAFDLDGHGQPVWNIVDAAGFEPTMLQAYLVLLVMKCTAAAIRFRPDDVDRQRDRADRVFDRYGI
ncbi:hypothetical protein [Actibacterium sp. 188UL27-1]|uniref:hypothetical protein n=1 Tax=Actibacterium sp. 188UL27-1 TaxID=2786961 RepID=UPI001958F7CF|nr:hypothetical protein [Actibacterium sp. 188UL27-1]MBM7066605.1 hypothetical protein [Actibacterium sp. 188UL27-1]